MSFYVYKDGRRLSDFDNMVDARKFAEISGGDLLADYLPCSESTVVDCLNEMSWRKCTEDSYPECEKNTLIAYKDEEWHYWMYNRCPYGWSVLCRGEGYWKTITSPEDDL